MFHSAAQNESSMNGATLLARIVLSVSISLNCERIGREERRRAQGTVATHKRDEREGYGDGPRRAPRDVATPLACVAVAPFLMSIEHACQRSMLVNVFLV